MNLISTFPCQFIPLPMISVDQKHSAEKMTYTQFKELIRSELQRNPHGMTWKKLQKNLALPYTRPCPEWTKALEKEIGLVREKKQGREFIWSIS